MAHHSLISDSAKTTESQTNAQLATEPKPIEPKPIEAESEKILCVHCKRTATNGIKCRGMCVADSDY